jgi:hypothetical protein
LQAPATRNRSAPTPMLRRDQPERNPLPLEVII